MPFGVGLADRRRPPRGARARLHPDDVYDTAAAVRAPVAVGGGSTAGSSWPPASTHLASWRLNEQQGLRDPLTGLANRTLLAEVLTAAAAPPATRSSVLLRRPRRLQGRQRLAGPRRRRRSCCARVADRLRVLRPRRATSSPASAVTSSRWSSARRRRRRPARRRAGSATRCATRWTSEATTCSSTPASGSPTPPRPQRAGRGDAPAQRRPGRCTWPRPPARTGSPSTPRGWTRPPRTGAGSARDLAGALAAGQLTVHYQATVAARRGAGVAATRRCCAGTTRSAAWSRPTCSSRSPRTPGTSSASAPGCWPPRRRRPPRGRAELGRPVGIAVNLSPRQLRRRRGPRRRRRRPARQRPAARRS